MFGLSFGNSVWESVSLCGDSEAGITSPSVFPSRPDNIALLRPGGNEMCVFVRVCVLSISVPERGRFLLSYESVWDSTMEQLLLSQRGRDKEIVSIWENLKKDVREREKRCKEGREIMLSLPGCQWVGWQHYIQCHPWQHHKSQPHTSPLASGSLAHTR